MPFLVLCVAIWKIYSGIFYKNKFPQNLRAFPACKRNGIIYIDGLPGTGKTTDHIEFYRFFIVS